MNRKMILAAAGAVVALAVLVYLVLSQPYTLHGSAIDPAQTAPAISLTSSSGTQFDLAQQRGQVVLVFFGFTNCPDMCPMTLAALRQVMGGLGSQAEQVKVAMVTVDPQRDSPEVLQRYLSAFGPRFTGLTGSETQLAPIWKSYGIYREIQSLGGDAYTVNHTVRIYVVDLKGNLRLTYPIDANVDDIVRDLKYLLKEG